MYLKDKGFLILLYLFSLTLYITTLVPTIYWGDSSEFVVTSYFLDISHPTSYPAYNILGKLFCYIPISNIGARVNLLSTFFSCLVIILLCIILNKILKNNISAITSSLIFSFSYTFWLHSTKAEVYTLYLFFFVALILILFKWKETQSINYLYLFIFILGLSLTNHLLIITFTISFLYFIMIFARKYKELFTTKNILISTFLFLLPLTIYLYLPLRSANNLKINWGRPQDIKQFKYVVSLEEGDTPSGVRGDDWNFSLEHFLKEANQRWHNQPLTLGITSCLKVASYFTFFIPIFFILRFIAFDKRYFRLFTFIILGIIIYLLIVGFYLLRIEIILLLPKIPFPSSIRYSVAIVLIPAVLLVMVFYLIKLSYFKHNKAIPIILFISFSLTVFTYFFLLYFAPQNVKENYPISIYFNYFIKQFTFVGFIVGVGGFVKLYKENIKISLFFISIFLMATTFLIIYIYPDNFPSMHERFSLPAYLIFSIFIGCGIKAIVDNIFYLSKKYNFKYPQLSYLIFFIAFIPLVSNYKECDKSKYYFADDYADNVLKTLPKDSILLANGIHTVFPMWWKLYIDKKTTGIKVVFVNMLAKEWYIKNIEKNINFSLSSEDTQDGSEKISHYIENIIKGNVKTKPIFYGGDISLIPKGIENVVDYGILFKVLPHQREITESEIEAFKEMIHKKYSYRYVQDNSVFKDNLTKGIIEFYAVSFYKLGNIYLNKNDLSNALIQFKKSIEILPEFIEGYNGLITISLKNGDVKSAINYCKKILTFHPNNYLKRFELAGLYYKNKLYNKSIEELIKTIKVAPNFLPARINLAHLYFITKKTESAKKELEKILKIDPENQQVKYYLKEISEANSN